MDFQITALTDAIRAAQPGKNITLSHGTVHYELEGPENGPVVVLIHGFSVPMYCWDPNFKYLVDAGFRVLRYDLYGRGFSDRPKIKYNLALFENQLLELLTRLDLLKSKINIVGLSMGGLITITFADHHPEYINKIVLFDPAGFPGHKTQIPGILRIPGINQLIFDKIGIPRLLERSPINLYRGVQNEKYPAYSEQFKIQLQYKGFTRAILSTMLNVPMHLALETYRSVGRKNLPIQLFWGDHDEVLACPEMILIREVLPHAEFHVVPDCGHTSNYERPEIVNPLVLKFLQT
jgi:pimeloyl-ACP methyl ester carboxylesterase